MKIYIVLFIIKLILNCYKIEQIFSKYIKEYNNSFENLENEIRDKHMDDIFKKLFIKNIKEYDLSNEQAFKFAKIATKNDNI